MTEYHRENDSKRAADWETLRRHQGGALGVECVQEVTVAVPDHKGYRVLEIPQTSGLTLQLREGP